MKMRRLGVLCATMLAFGAGVMAGESAYIDMGKVASDYHVAIAKTEAFKEKRKQVIEKIAVKSRELQLVKTKFAAFKPAANETADAERRRLYIEAARELQLKALKLEAELKEFYDLQEAIVKKEYAELNTEIQQELEFKLAAFAREKHLEAVFDVSGRAIAYYDRSKDITSVFLGAINAGHEDYVMKMKEKLRHEALNDDPTTAALNAAEALLKQAETPKAAIPAAAPLPPPVREEKKKPAIPVVSPALED